MKEKKCPVTFSITKEVIDNFRKYCEKNGMRMSKRVEILIKKDIEKPFEN